jgi:hypothetical protein
MNNMKKLRGKYLVRRTKLVNGAEGLILTGVFYPDFDINEINENDEMWVSDITIGNGLRFTDPVKPDAGSPEDFLDGNCMSPKDWKTKSEL